MEEKERMEKRNGKKRKDGMVIKNNSKKVGKLLRKNGGRKKRGRAHIVTKQ